MIDGQLAADNGTLSLSIPAINLFRYPGESGPSTATGAKGSLRPI